MRIPDDTIEDVRRASDIVDVIGGYVQLKKRGKNYLGLCPFHQEKTPSFSVSPEKQMYYCFGCGVGGNVFTFIMERDKVSFVEAVRVLGERAGIAIPDWTNDADQATEHEELYAAVRFAGVHFHDNLTATVEGKLALEYFRHRGFTDQTIRKFGLGYSMHSWDDLAKHAGAGNITSEQLERAGLLVRRDDGSYYDRFRGRAMFPIFSPSGRPVGFGARKLRDDDPVAGKYINSPETPIYQKSRLLYGLWHAREAVRGSGVAILVEGYADLITLHQAGVTNVVASSGTALTEDQIRLIGRYAKKITIVYDADSAGSKAAMRGADLVIQNGFDVYVVTLPEGDDPDTFVRKHGAEEFRAMAENAVAYLDFIGATFRQQGLLATPEGKAEAVRTIVATLAKMPDELKRNFYIKNLAEQFGIYESILFRELEKINKRTVYPQNLREERSLPQEPRVSPPSGLSSSGMVSAAERELIKAMFEVGPEMIAFVARYLTSEAFRFPRARASFDLAVQRVQSGDPWDMHLILNAVSDVQLRNFIAEIVSTRYEISKGWTEFGQSNPWEVAEQSIKRLKVEELEGLIAENLLRMKNAKQRGEDVTPLMEENIRLQQEKKATLSTPLIRNGAAAGEGPSSGEAGASG
jgi:DNA primase